MPKTFIKPQMRAALSKHKLEMVGEGRWRFRDPEQGYIMSFVVAEVDRRIIITGDIVFGQKGVISERGYSMAWLVGATSERYLCEKFLREKWQDGAAIEELEWRKAEVDKGQDEMSTNAYAEMNEALEGLRNGSIDSPDQLHDVLRSHDNSDGVPGYDYLWEDAGWLCAIQECVRREMIAAQEMATA